MQILTTVLEIIPILVSILAVWVAYTNLLRTPKIPEPAIPPTCLTIIGVNSNQNIRDLPGYHGGKESAGFNRC